MKVKKYPPQKDDDRKKSFEKVSKLNKNERLTLKNKE